jgi:predicted metal-dependent enzyme (double-stranded beta helix superfamily)
MRTAMREAAVKAPRFDAERFIDDCKRASQQTTDTQAGVQEVLAQAIANPSAVLSGLGAPLKGGLRTLHRCAELTILNIVWPPLMQLMPHEHGMWCLIGIYTGREDNIFWQRREAGLEARQATAVVPGNVVALARDVIHSVTNPTEKLTGAIHIYGGDFFATPRAEWDPETLAERTWDIDRTVRVFEQSNERFYQWRKRSERLM